MDGHDVVQAMREAVETVPGLGDRVALYGTASLPFTVVGLGKGDPGTGGANHLQVRLREDKVFYYSHDALTRVMPQGQEEEVVA